MDEINISLELQFLYIIEQIWNLRLFFQMNSRVSLALRFIPVMTTI